MLRLAAVLLSVVTLGAPLVSAAEMEKAFPTSAGQKLEVDLKTGGPITIVGWDKDTVSVQATRQGRDSEKASVEMENRPTGVFVGSRFAGTSGHGDASIRLEINIPRRYDVEVQSMGGPVTIENVEGTIRGKTMGGELQLRRLKGMLGLTTMGGPIRLSDSDVDGSVETMGGPVEVDNVTGNVAAKTLGGNVIRRDTRKGQTEGRESEVQINSMGGDIKVDDAPRGAKLRTMGGGIQVGSAKFFVEAATMGGNVSIDDVDGWVEASTMGGSVTVVMSGNPAKGDRHVTLSSMSGDITLTVPSELSMDFDIELAFTKGNAGKYSIVSDFPVSQETTPDWDYEGGSPRKVIHGTGAAGTGANPVKIKTVNGNVVMKKI